MNPRWRFSDSSQKNLRALRHGPNEDQPAPGPAAGPQRRPQNRERITHIDTLILARAPQPEPIEKLSARYETKQEAFNQDVALARELATKPLGQIERRSPPRKTSPP